MESFDVIVLAAGLGTRMKSEIPKVLHEISGKPLIFYVLETVVSLEPSRIILVVGFGGERVVQVVNGFGIGSIPSSFLFFTAMCRWLR